MKENTISAKNMERVLIITMMALNIRVNGKIITSQELVIMHGKTVECTKVNGLKTTCMDTVPTHGIMADNMKVSTNKTRKTVMEFTHGKMEEFMMANGKMACKMVSVTIKAKKMNNLN